ARYYTPSGRSIQAKGIEPDVVMDQGKQVAKGDVSGPLLREANLPRHLQHPGKDGATDRDADTDGADAETTEVGPPDGREGELEQGREVEDAVERRKRGQVQRTTVAQRAG